MSDHGLPHFASGKVVKGFGRGSKQLGCPTANFDSDVVKNLPKEVATGVYYGWAQVDKGPLYKMVMSIGWNPFYNNTEKSMEVHILNKFPEDFYGHHMKICMVGYLRAEESFSSVDDLIKKINEDISKAKEALEEPRYSKLKSHSFFSQL